MPTYIKTNVLLSKMNNIKKKIEKKSSFKK